MNGIEMSVVRFGLYPKNLQSVCEKKFVLSFQSGSFMIGTLLLIVGLASPGLGSVHFKRDGVASIVVVFELGEGGRVETL